MSIPQPSILTNLVSYNVLGNSGISVAMDTTGKVHIWGTNADYLYNAVPQVPGYKSIAWIDQDYPILFLINVNRELEIYYQVDESIDYSGTGGDKNHWAWVNRPVSLLGNNKVIVGSWKTQATWVRPYHDTVHGPRTGQVVAVVRDNDVYIWHSNFIGYYDSRTGYELTEELGAPIAGHNYGSSLEDLSSSFTYLYSLDPTTILDVYPLSESATVTLTKADKQPFSSCTISCGSRMVCWPKPGDLGVGLEANATLSIHYFTPEYAKCFFFTRAICGVYNGMKAPLTGGAYELRVVAKLGDVSNNLRGNARVTVKGESLDCLDMNWYLISVIQDELEASKNCKYS